MGRGRVISKEGERLGCKWGLASKWTSFIAIDEPTASDIDKDDTGIDYGNTPVHRTTTWICYSHEVLNIL